MPLFAERRKLHRRSLDVHYVIMLNASSGKRNVTVWRPSVRLSVRLVGILNVTYQEQHASRPAYISARQ